MSGNCREYPGNTRCDNDLPIKPGERICQTFDICLPFGASLKSDGICISYEPGAPPVDGVYGGFVVENGCITEVRDQSIPTYTPAPCTPNPAPCTGEGGGSALILSSDAANLLYWDATSRLLAKLFYQNTANVVIQGDGTSNSPLRISVNVDDPNINVTSTTKDVLLITENPTNTFTINMATVDASLVGIHAGFEIDRFGRVIGYTETSATGVLDIKNSTGNITITSAEGIYFIDLPTMHTENQRVQVGSSELTIDMQGRVSGIVASPETVKSAFCFISTGFRDNITYSFTTEIVGRFRISYKGNTGLSSSSTETLINIPSTVQITVDGQTVSGYAVVSSGDIIGFELVTPGSYSPGTHIINIALPASISSLGILDVILCQ